MSNYSIDVMEEFTASTRSGLITAIGAMASEITDKVYTEDDDAECPSREVGVYKELAET